MKAEYVQPKVFLDMHGDISVFLNGFGPLERKYLTLLLLMMTEKQDIRETYQNLGNNGSPIFIYKSVFTPDSIYL